MLVESVVPQMVEWRRHLHMHPELSFEEHETSRFVAGVLGEIPGVEVSRPTPTSVMGVVRGAAGDGPCVALRADIDALPIHEETELEFRSRTDGVMHACGHDGHAAMLLGAASVLAAMAPELRGEVRFLFQHAEELPPGGAREMIAAGVMDGVDVVTGCHLIANIPVGGIAVAAGPWMAAADMFTVRIRGKGGHGAMPQYSVDPVAVGAQVVTNLQHVVSRRTSALDRVVVSVTQFHGGTADNIIPEEVRLGGTVRTFEETSRERTRAAMEQTIAGVVAAHGASYELDYVVGYDPVVNDAGVADLVARCAQEIDGVELVHFDPMPGGDDVAYYLQQAPGAYFFVGAQSEEARSTFPHHHPRFAIDERSLPHGAETLVRSALAALA